MAQGGGRPFVLAANRGPDHRRSFDWRTLRHRGNMTSPLFRVTLIAVEMISQVEVTWKYLCGMPICLGTPDSRTHHQLTGWDPLVVDHHPPMRSHQ